MTIRPYTRDDIPAIADVHVKGWQSSYSGIVDQGYLDDLKVEDKIKSWTEIIDKDDTFGLVAENDQGEIIGFTSFGRLRTPPPGMSPIRPLYASELYAIYILPEYWRQGIGTQLISASAQRLKDEKFPSFCLWVLDKNKRANAFYKKIGGQRCGKMMIEIGPDTVKEVCYGWRDINAVITA